MNGLTQSKFARLLLPVLIVGAALAIAWLLVTQRPQPDSTPVDERVVLVETIPVSRSDVTITVRSQGTVRPRTETTLVAEVSGVVRSVSDKLVAGGFVRQGEVLLTLDDADFQVAVEQSRANLLTAQAQLMQEQAQSEQAAKEWDLSGRPRENAPVLALRTPYLREAEARVLFAESDLERARRQLERTRIKAPYDALVREKIADVGQFLGTGGQVARIFATDYAEVRLPLSDQDLVWLRLPSPGQAGIRSSVPVTLFARAAGRQQHWQGQIVRTEGVVDNSSRMHYAVARIDDPYALASGGSKTPLISGTFVSAELEGVTLAGIFRVPLTALYNGNEVLVMDPEQRLRRRSVNIVHSDADWVYIDEGLQDQDRLIVSPVQIPVDGMRVNPGLDAS